ncbi:MAG: hypothetical protein GY906_27865 [bacterium]|nr:hypothetical protein [bacterium]
MPRRKRSIKRSGFEDKIAKDLDERGIEYEFEPWELEYFSKVHGGVVWDTADDIVSPITWVEARKRRWYTPDFVIQYFERADAAASDLVIEAKGRLTGPTRTKMLDVKAAHPDLDIRFLFYRKEKVRPSLKRTPYNTDWAEAYGFPYAVGHEIPEEWL